MGDDRGQAVRTELWEAASDIVSHAVLFAAFFWLVVVASTLTSTDPSVVIALYVIGLYVYEFRRLPWQSYVGATAPATVLDFKRLSAKWTIFLPLAVLAINTVAFFGLVAVLSPPWAQPVQVLASDATVWAGLAFSDLAVHVLRSFLCFLVVGNVVAIGFYFIGFTRG
ncbi:hypothetical protein ACOZ4N_10230 [Halorientalis pallida]|uniref:hypothetical protein n=1 Tax=Halorientalis pallida TaxID=2479928 RepID=UPI003C701D3E